MILNVPRIGCGRTPQRRISEAGGKVMRLFNFRQRDHLVAGAARGPAVALCAVIAIGGCKSAGEFRKEADSVAGTIIEQKQQEALGKTESFTIERPADELRRRLMLEQGLQYSHPGSLGASELEPIEHWPNDDYLEAGTADMPRLVEDLQPLRLSLIEALQVAARSSREYQTQKEEVYRAALALDLERDAFRNTFAGIVEGLISTDHSGGDVVTGVEGGAIGSVSRTLKNGTTLTSRIAVDLAKLLTMDRSSSFGILFDASIEIPLLRGAGRWIVAEPLTQAERDAVYAIYTFERFKRTFAVRIATDYLGVLRQLDEVDNSRENYRRLISATRRARRLADAGRLPEVQVDQAVQDQLRARNRWIAAGEAYTRRLDNFKILLGLPTDAVVELDRDTLAELAALVESNLPEQVSVSMAMQGDVPPADEPIELETPDRTAGGPMEMADVRAVELALENRLDLRIAQGAVYDAQRQVTVAANGFLPELTLLGSASAGQRRSIGSATSPDAQLRFERGRYDALLTMDLPLERTAERNIYRNTLIAMERAVRDLQALEDRVKFEVRDDLRNLLEFRESLRIQAQAVALAQRRVESTTLFLEAGRAEIRDLLEAQEALVSAQNALTAALVNYRVAELNLQSDLGLLEVDETGLWQEYSPEKAGESRG